MAGPSLVLEDAALGAQVYEDLVASHRRRQENEEADDEPARGSRDDLSGMTADGHCACSPYPCTVCVRSFRMAPSAHETRTSCEIPLLGSSLFLGR